jgi:hypothetical protein
MPARLAIDYGSGYTKAVLVWPDGRWTLLGFDGGYALSNAVCVTAEAVVVGAAAWQRAETEPGGFVLAPLRAGTVEVHIGGADVEVADLVAATLRRVAAEAVRVAGAPVLDVRMVVPAGWGPRRRTWFRRVAASAGLGQPRLIEAPVAAAAPRAADDDEAPPSVRLVVDIGAGCEVSVVRRVPAAGMEVLSTLAGPDLGGDCLDAGLVEAATGRGVDDWPAEQRWPLVASVRVAKHALAEQAAVTMPLPDGSPPVVVNSLLLRQAARPVLERVGELAGEAVRNAGLTMAEIEAVDVVGAAAAVPGATEMIAVKLGVVPRVAEQPGVAAVLGAGNATPSSPPTGVDQRGELVGRLPPLRRLLGLLLPGLASLVLYGHFTFSAEFNNGTPNRPSAHYYVLASWGELAVAAVLALVACLQASAILAEVLDQTATEQRPGRGGKGRISAGIALAVAAGMAMAGLYAVTAGVYFAQPVAGPLRWAVLPILPTVAACMGLAVIAWRRPGPAGGWDSLLAFPVSATMLGAVGILAVAGWWHGHLPAWFIGWEDTLGYLGGVLLGAAVACTLVRHLLARLVLAGLLGFFCLIISRSGPDILAVIYALAVSTWWAHRAWAVFRIPEASHAR